MQLISTMIEAVGVDCPEADAGPKSSRTRTVVYGSGLWSRCHY